ncbi:MAG: AmmeMemoRadiSam system protein A [Chloroflexota bacterium]
MGVVFGCVVPHPPVLLPEVGGDMAATVEPTVEAIHDLGRRIAAYDPQTLVLISPHGPILADRMAVGLAPEARGDFSSFNAPGVTVQASCDVGLAAAIRTACERVAIGTVPVDSLTSPESGGAFYQLDHGAAVPLHFLLPLLPQVRLVLLGFSALPRPTHVAFGERIREACDRSGQRVVFVASGDLSHRLTPSAPYGYDPQGRVFDERVVAAVAEGDWDALLGLPSMLVERAGVCGYLSMLTLAGVMRREVRGSRVLSYQGPFGVGYMVAEMEPVAAGSTSSPDPIPPAASEDEIGRDDDVFHFPEGDFKERILALARASVRCYVDTGRKLRLPTDVPEDFRGRKACFVTLRQAGDLRGCVGTILPTQPNLAEEVRENAVGAASRDPRFVPVRRFEQDWLAYSVDLLSPPEPVSSSSDLDPRRYGLIVQQAERMGVLLPGIEQITTVEQQFQACCEKAGITTSDGVQMYRFEVERSAEPGAEH